MVTAVLCSGAALPREVWAPVAAVAPDLRSLVVERPGLDRAVEGRMIVPPSLAEASSRIRAVVGQARGPVVLVAHSMAAFPAESALREGMPGVVGVVLVDPSVGPEPRLLAAGAHVVAGLASLAPRRFLPRTLDNRGPWWSAHLTRAGALAAGAAEAAAYNRWHAELLRVRESRPALPEVPVRLLSVTGRSGSSGDGAWLRAHRELARVWSVAGAAPVDVVESRGSHLLMRSRPRAVADAIRAVAARER